MHSLQVRSYSDTYSISRYSGTVNGQAVTGRMTLLQDGVLDPNRLKYVVPLFELGDLKGSGSGTFDTLANLLKLNMVVVPSSGDQVTLSGTGRAELGLGSFILIPDITLGGDGLTVTFSATPD